MQERRHNIFLVPGEDGWMAKLVSYYTYRCGHLLANSYTLPPTLPHTRRRSEKPSLETSCGTRVRLRISIYATSLPRYDSTLRALRVLRCHLNVPQLTCEQGQDLKIFAYGHQPLYSLLDHFSRLHCGVVTTNSGIMRARNRSCKRNYHFHAAV